MKEKKEWQRAVREKERVPRSPKKAPTWSGRAPLTNAISCRSCGYGMGSFFPFGRYFISPVPQVRSSTALDSIRRLEEGRSRATALRANRFSSFFSSLSFRTGRNGPFVTSMALPCSDEITDEDTEKYICIV